MELHRPRLEFAVAQQVGLILAQVRLIELVGRPVKMLGEPLDGQPSPAPTDVGGQTLTQSPQPVHLSVSMVMKKSPEASLYP